MFVIPPATGRVEFRAWGEGDIETFHAICRDLRVVRHVGDGRAWSREQTVRFIERAKASAADCGFCQWPLIHRSDATLIGYCGFVNSDEGPEIGWRLAADYWGQGLATEAARHVLEFGFSTLGFTRVVATIQSPNIASARVAEKLGMRRVRAEERGGREVGVYVVEADGRTKGGASKAESGKPRAENDQ